MEDQVIDGKQIKQARALLHWTPKQLAKAAGVRIEAIERAEHSTGDLPLTIAHAAAIQRAMERAGIEVTSNGQPEMRCHR
jgi:transcriptional regulator with XRE-family HTH domain